MHQAEYLPSPDKILHLKTPNWPQFRFEYHPKIKKVYLIRVGIEPEIGQVFAHEIENEGQAWNAVLIFLRGYREARSEIEHDQRYKGPFAGAVGKT